MWMEQRDVTNQWRWKEVTGDGKRDVDEDGDRGRRLGMDWGRNGTRG